MFFSQHSTKGDGRPSRSSPKTTLHVGVPDRDIPLIMFCNLLFLLFLYRFHVLLKTESMFLLFINKSHKLLFYKKTIASTHPLQYIYTDVWTSLILSLDNLKYYLIFVDHLTWYMWFYPLKKKSHVKETFITVKSLVKTNFGKKIHNLCSDNVGEFIALRAFHSTHGISHFTFPPHTPEHNGFLKESISILLRLVLLSCIRARSQ